jgi:hypothetical protein
MFLKTLISSFVLMCLLQVLQAQNLQSPEQFLGYKLGSRYTQNYQLVNYFTYLSNNSSLKLKQYGTTYENRPLLAAFISSKANLDKLEEIRTNNLKLAGLLEGQGNTESPVLVWLSYGVHGNETSSTEAAMQTAYELLQDQNAKYLENTVVILDPCLNPDGRDRYANWYVQMQGLQPNPSTDAKENHEPSTSGRQNHYLFDLNRDWAWQTQRETQQRNVLYQQWLPHIHADFHEMGANSSYYFAPAAEPYHTEITSFQRSFQVEIGKNHAKYFDKNAWLYYTKERFDLLYPSYGDSYPMFNGAIGMTYEQGGLGKGIEIYTANGEVLTLKDRIAHHHTVGISTVEISSLHSKKIVEEFKKYFDNAKNPTSTYKTYVIAGTNVPNKIKEVTTFLDKHQIRYGFANNNATLANSYNYFTNKNETFNITTSDIVIPVAQPKSALLRVLFNPKTTITDSLTYDATAWGIPYMFGVQSFACSEKIAMDTNKKPFATKITTAIPEKQPLAYICEWKSFTDLQFLTALLQAGVQVRFAEVPFTLHKKTYQAGTLLIIRTDNKQIASNFSQTVLKIADSMQQTLIPTETGFADSGVDFGSDAVYKITPPQIAILSGADISSTSFGQIWHYFDELLKYPVTTIDMSYFSRVNLNNYQVLILPDGAYNLLDSEDKLEKLRNWVQRGGKIIAMEGANQLFADKKEFALTKHKDEKIDEKNTLWANKDLLKKYGNRERNYLTNVIQGSIYKTQLDNTHPLGFGYPDFYYTLRQTSDVYDFFKEAWNVAVITENAYVDGFAGAKAKTKMKNSVVFGVENIGKGTMVYLLDDVLFRNSWNNGFLLFGNAVFMVGK